MTPPPAELTGLLLRRASLVERLGEGAAHKPTLADDCGVSRSTVDRGIRELADAGLVRRGDEGFVLTAFGELAAAAFRDLQGELGKWADAADLLAAVPAAGEVDVGVLRGADVTTMSAFPRPLVEAVLAGADRARIAFPLVPLVYGSVEYAGDVAVPSEVELLLDGSVVEAVERHYAAELGALLARDGVSVYTTGTELPYCFGVLGDGDDRWLVAVFRLEDGSLGVVRNGRSDAVAWGDDRYRRYRADASRYEPPERVRVVESAESD